jgi:SAM-dependent methyltransferase
LEAWLEHMVYADKFRGRDGLYIDAAAGEAETVFARDAHADLFRVEDGSFWFRHRNRVIRACIDRCPPENGAIIEVGGGNGCVTAYLEKYGYKMAMFEPGLTGAVNAKKRGVGHVFRAYFNRETVRENSVPAIGLFDVLEHIEDDRAFLLEIRSLLRDGGLIYLTVPAFQALWSQADEAGHFRRYRRKPLLALLQSCGCAVRYASYFFWFLPLPVFLLRSLPYRLGKRGAASPRQNRLNKKEFIMPGWTDKMIDLLLAPELQRIENGKTMPGGGSIFITAQKK